jgi:hypothetical protein
MIRFRLMLTEGRRITGAELERCTPRPKVAVTIARELTGIVWATMRLGPQ